MSAALLLVLGGCWLGQTPLHAKDPGASYLDDAYYQNLTRLSEERIKLLHPTTVRIPDEAWQDIIKGLRPDDIRALAAKYPIPQNLVPGAGPDAKTTGPATPPGPNQPAPAGAPADKDSSQPDAAVPGGGARTVPSEGAPGGAAEAGSGDRSGAGGGGAGAGAQGMKSSPGGFSGLHHELSRIKKTPDLFGPDGDRLAEGQNMAGAAAAAGAQNLPRNAADEGRPGRTAPFAPSPLSAAAPEAGRSGMKGAPASGPAPGAPSVEPRTAPSRYSIKASLRSVPPLQQPAPAGGRPRGLAGGEVPAPGPEGPQGPAASADSDQLSAQELSDLKEIRDLLNDAAETGALDSDRMDAEVQRLAARSSLESRTVAAILGRAEELLAGLGGPFDARQRGELAVLAGELGLSRLTPEQVERLVRSMETARPASHRPASPPAPASGRRPPLWERLWLWLAGLGRAGVGWLRRLLLWLAASLRRTGR